MKRGDILRDRRGVQFRVVAVIIENGKFRPSLVRVGSIAEAINFPGLDGDHKTPVQRPVTRFP